MHESRSRHACVVVLGEIARSPRMQYHAEALAADGWTVRLVGYAQDGIPAALAANPRIRCHALRERWAPRRADLPRATFFVLAGTRLVDQCAQLLRALAFSNPAPDLVLVQTPPALPTLPVAWAVARLRRARVVVDWHNFGHAMLALRLDPSGAAVRSARALEGLFGRRADAHLSVSRAMRERLAREWNIDAVVLSDRPAACFRRLDPDERRRFLEAHATLLPRHDPEAPQRDAVVATSTSWTADEDFPLLLEAAANYDARRSADPASLPGLRLLVTGRGPLRERFEADFHARGFRHVRLHTAWLEAADYPLALGCADLGVSLHRSASGVDLPMKVADMVGCGLPVCMLDYGPCVREMLGPDNERMMFRDASGLSALWAGLLQGFPGDAAPLFQLAGERSLAGGGTWLEGWRREAAPLLSPEPP